MSVRDWDKLRRQDKARSYHSAIDNFRPRKTKYSKRRPKSVRARFLKTVLKAHRSAIPLPPKKPKVCWLQVKLPRGEIAYAVFVRAKLDGPFRCTGTDHPDLDWFTRIIDVMHIFCWLNDHHYSYLWLSHNPVGSSSHSKPTEHSPAEADTPTKASQSSDPNTGQLVKIQPPSLASPQNRGYLGATPEQTGITKPCCLIES